MAGLTDTTITLDGNHPLADQTLNFDVNIVSVREATSEELEHGHVHGAVGGARSGKANRFRARG